MKLEGLAAAIVGHPAGWGLEDALRAEGKEPSASAALAAAEEDGGGSRDWHDPASADRAPSPAHQALRLVSGDLSAAQLAAAAGGPSALGSGPALLEQELRMASAAFSAERYAVYCKQASDMQGWAMGCAWAGQVPSKSVASLHTLTCWSSGGHPSLWAATNQQCLTVCSQAHSPASRAQVDQDMADRAARGAYDSDEDREQQARLHKSARVCRRGDAR
jgi:hypothetical protein